jgi:hypothetical protein
MSEQKKIEIGMSDKERAKILKKKKLVVVPCDKSKIDANMLNALATATRVEAVPVLKRLADEFGDFKQYENTSIDVSFRFSKNSLDESMSKQKGRFDDYALMLTNFDGVIKNAVGIEAHENRYHDGEKNLKGIYVLVSAFSDENRICPVKLEVKHFDEGQSSKLHIAVTKTEIKIDGVSAYRKRVLPSDVYPRPSSNIIISDLMKKVNTSDGDLLKYFPKQMLAYRQRQAALDAKAAEELYIKRKQAERDRLESMRGKHAAVSKPQNQDAVTSNLQQGITAQKPQAKHLNPKGKGKNGAGK